MIASTAASTSSSVSGPSGVIRSFAPTRRSGGTSGAGRAVAQPVEVGAGLAGELDDVLEALRGHEHRLRALALEQRVGGRGRAVGELLDVLAVAPARSSTAVTAFRTPSDWSSGVVGAFAVTSRPPTASTASVKVPPTSTPRSIGRGR